MIVLLFIASLLNNADARVYCQDRQATVWKSLGHACTITCNTILGAIERLKQSDYLHLVNEHGLHTLELANMSDIDLEIERRYRRLSSIDVKYEQTYEAFMKIVPTEQFLSDFKFQLVNITNVLNMTCYLNSNETRIIRKVLNDCTSFNMPKGYIYKNFMRFLNRYAHEEKQFDWAMTLIILKHLLSNVNIRYGHMMESLVLFLKRELRPHSKRLVVHKKDRISLTAKDCMSVFLPGCYCVKGYVEDNGRCVKPDQCADDHVFFEYFQRIDIF